MSAIQATGQTATIAVKYVNPPKAQGKSGTVKDANDQLWGYWPDRLPEIAGKVGQTINVEYSTREYQGKTYKTISKILADAPQTNGAEHKPNGSPSHTKSVEMAVMGIIGRTFQGTGTIPPENELTDMLRRVRRAWESAMAPEEYGAPF